VRLLLDAHLSPRRVAAALRELGHDVRAAGEERELDGRSDEDLLALAASEERVLVTCDVKDFGRIVRQWAAAERSHAGCAIIVGIDHREFGTIVSALLRELDTRPNPEAWRGYTCFVTRRD
jgi:predicted nuclease of predicted toxin-antitoxin system